MRYAFPANIEPEEDGGYTVTFAGLSEVGGGTWGETYEEALREGADCLITMLSFYVDRGQAIPKAPAAEGRPMISVTVLESAKLALHDGMIAGQISNVELGRRIGMDEKGVRRLRDPLHASKIEAIETALRAVGRRMVVEIEEIAA